MAKFNVVDMNGQHVSEIELSDAVFGITPNEKAVHIAVVNFLASSRTHGTVCVGAAMVLTCCKKRLPPWWAWRNGSIGI